MFNLYHICLLRAFEHIHMEFARYKCFIYIPLNSSYTFYFEIVFIFNGVRELNLFNVILSRYAHDVVYFAR